MDGEQKMASYIMQQQRVYQQKFAFGEPPDSTSRLAKRAKHIKKQVPLGTDYVLDAATQLRNDEEDDSDLQPDYVEAPSTSADDQPGPAGFDKAEENDSDQVDRPVCIEVPSTSTDGQLGPSGVGKSTTEAPALEEKLADDSDIVETITFIVEEEPQKVVCAQNDVTYLRTSDDVNIENLIQIREKYRCATRKCENMGPESLCKHHLQLYKSEAQLPPINPNKQQCYICDAWFASREDLLSHQTWFHFGKSHSCKQCNKSFSTVQMAELHIAKIHGVISYKGNVSSCSYCSKEIYTTKHYTHHVRLHIDPNFESLERSFLCDICKKAYGSKQKLYNHKHTSHKKKTLKCKECGKKFNDRTKLKTHLGSHAKKGLNICMECQESFESNPELLKHCTKTGHEKPKESFLNPKRPTKCDVCSKWFSSKFAMLHHKECVHAGKRYSCEKCRKEYGSMGSYRAHLEQHEANYSKPTFTCHNCSKTFASKKNLQVHVKSHNSALQQIIKCDLCDKKFKSVDTLRVHKKEKHSNEKSFVCEICGKKFASKSYLDSHKKNHSRVKPVKPVDCKFCANTYKTKRSLREHMRFKHPNEMKKIVEEETPEICGNCRKRFRSVKHLKNHIKRMHFTSV